MPILTPIDAFYFLNYFPDIQTNSLKKLLSQYLSYASENILLNSTYLSIYRSFMNFVNREMASILDQLCQLFDISTDIDSLINSFKTDKNNYYQSFQNLLGDKYKLSDEYIEECINMQSYPHTSSKTQQPFKRTNYVFVLYSNECFSVTVSLMSYAVITLKKVDKSSMSNLFFFFSYILAGSGYKIVLIVHQEPSFEYINYLLGCYPLFSELHLFREDDYDYSYTQLIEYDYLFIYIYVSSFKQLTGDIIKKNRKKNAFIQVFHFGQSLFENFQRSNETGKERFSYSQYERKFQLIQIENPTDIKTIPMNIFNLQLFDTSDLEVVNSKEIILEDRIFINSDDYFSWNGSRIKVYSTEQCNKEKGYVDPIEIHHLKIDLFIKDPIYLSEMTLDQIESIKLTRDRCYTSAPLLDKILSKRPAADSSLDSKLQYAFSKLYKYWTSNKPTTPHLAQIAVVAQAMEFLYRNVEHDFSSVDYLTHYLLTLVEECESIADILDVLESKSFDDIPRNLVSDFKLNDFRSSANISPELESKFKQATSQSDNPYRDLSLIISFIEKYIDSKKLLLIKKRAESNYREEPTISLAELDEKEKSKLSKRKGCIFQVKTGEGKSIIIAALAEIIARTGKKVHVVTSNILLACRDYEKSFNYFDKCNIQSGVLLHKSEFDLNIQTLQGDTNTFYPKKSKSYYHDDAFNNSINMNSNIMIDKQYRVIFSTFFNFEACYLKQSETNEIAANESLQNTVLILDEADTILIDELMNGTVLAREMKSNVNDILNLVYELNELRRDNEIITETFQRYREDWNFESIYSIVSLTQEENRYKLKTKDQKYCHLKSSSEKPTEMDKAFERYAARQKFMYAMLENIVKSLWPHCKNGIFLHNIQSLVKKENTKVPNLKRYDFILTLKSRTVLTATMEMDQLVELNTFYYLFTATDINNNYIKDALRATFSGCCNLTDQNVQEILDDLEDAISYRKGSEYVIGFEDEVGKIHTNLEKTCKTKRIGHIYPYDSKQNGIIQKDKSFDGFIQQFIAIKEQHLNKDSNISIKIEPLSLNYAYLSHPIYTNLYYGVWGLTGTIGQPKDIKILKDYYQLDIIKIPRNSSNKRKDLPMILVDKESTKNELIIQEIQFYHRLDRPVLIIFDDLNKLDDMEASIRKTIPDATINIFKGTNHNNSNKNRIEDVAGAKKMITLGSNFCGRGTNIKCDDKYPLHVIISFGTTNTRALKQAYGRTARNNQSGTTRIICSKEENAQSTEYQTKMTKEILTNYSLIQRHQAKFINKIRQSRSWIFSSSGIDYAQYNHIDYAAELQSAFINVNRHTAFNYQYPICMTIPTFMKIQLQKIFSLKNCPVGEYTWRLFQQYMRELVLESYSIWLQNIYKTSIHQPIYQFKKEIKNSSKVEFRELFQLLDSNSCSMPATFFRIYHEIIKKWEPVVLKLFPKDAQNCHRNPNPDHCVSYRLGFYPYEIKNKEGSRVLSISDDDSNAKVNFIQDPEISYPSSVSYFFDDIFDKVCNLFNSKLKELIGMYIYIRRGFGGCEFGICIDPYYDPVYPREDHCLLDLNPLLIFAIVCKSKTPIIVGIIIIVLIVLSVIAEKIANYLKTLSKSTISLLRKLAKQIASKAIEVVKDKIVEKVEDYNPLNKALKVILNWLYELLNIELAKIGDSKYILVIRTILSTINNANLNHSSEKFHNLCFNTLKLSSIGSSIFSAFSPSPYILKIGVCLILLIAAFIYKFRVQASLKTETDEREDGLDEKTANFMTETSSTFQKEMKSAKKRKSKNAENIENFQSYQKAAREANFTVAIEIENVQHEVLD